MPAIVWERAAALATRGPLIPLQKLAERGAAVAVPGLFFGGQFGESFLNLREVEQRVIAEAMGALGTSENHPFGLTVKHREHLPLARGGDHTYESPGAPFRGNISQLAK